MLLIKQSQAKNMINKSWFESVGGNIYVYLPHCYMFVKHHIHVKLQSDGYLLSVLKVKMHYKQGGHFASKLKSNETVTETWVF